MKVHMTHAPFSTGTSNVVQLGVGDEGRLRDLCFVAGTFNGRKVFFAWCEVVVG